MVNKISEKFFTQKDFSRESARALEKIAGKTGFKINREIWRGVIYDKNKVGSIIFDGKHQSQPAVLKIQGLKPELDEIEIIKLFNKFNQSKRIEVPTVFAAQKWNKQDGFGFLIQEKLNATKRF